MSDRQLSFGLWYDFRNPQQWKQNDTELYEKCIAQIARAEDMGFEDVWLSEHHFFEDNYSPSMLAIGCAIAARTKKIRIGTSVLLLRCTARICLAHPGVNINVVSRIISNTFDRCIGRRNRRSSLLFASRMSVPGLSIVNGRPCLCILSTTVIQNGHFLMLSLQEHR